MVLEADARFVRMGKKLILNIPVAIHRDSSFPFKAGDTVRILVDPDSEVIHVIKLVNLPAFRPILEGETVE